jgi:hypothetical protein
MDDDYSRIYRLEPPNSEVRNAFIEHLAQAYSELGINEMAGLHDDMQRQIRTCDCAGLERSLRAMNCARALPVAY